MSCPAHAPHFGTRPRAFRAVFSDAMLQAALSRLGTATLTRWRATGVPPTRPSTRLVSRLLACGWLLCAGCSQPSPPLASSNPVTAAVAQHVLAQGQILPAGGILHLSAPPGDVVTNIAVSVGDQVQPGQVLLTLRSGQAAESRLKTLHKRREQAVREREQAIASAQQQLASADLKLEQLKAQQVATQRTTDLLELAKQQVESSEKVLKKLQAIAANAATSEFVGGLEIDRQRIHLAEAQLNYRRQAESQQQSEDELTWGLQAAEQQRHSASKLLAAAESSQAIEILDLEIAAVIEQTESTRVVAPTSGMILAINVAPGEATLAGPLIEMADLSSLVCEIEINAMDATAVQPGQAATITSRALGTQTLRGTVTKKFSLVGRPQLRSLDPLAQSDYRTVTATIQLDEASTAIAKDWLQLQVEARIDTESASAVPRAAKSPQPAPASL